MKITFLGTGSGAPSRARNVSSLALQLVQSGRLWLFDCGEGTQHQILRSPLRLSQLERIFVTHLHGDHLFGLPGLLASRSLQDSARTPVTLYGPAGLDEYVRCCLRLSGTQLQYPLQVETVAPGAVFDLGDVQVTAAPLRHRVPTFGYAVVERDLPGRFDVARAQSLGIPAGPVYGRLQRGETLILDDGRVVHGRDLLGPPRPGRKLAFCGDTTETPQAVALAQGADVLVHEATYLERDRPLADRAQHSTALMAAETARAAGVKTLILTHFSPRYEAEGGGLWDEMLAEARAVFPSTLLARDGWSFELPRPE